MACLKQWFYCMLLQSWHFGNKKIIILASLMIFFFGKGKVRSIANHLNWNLLDFFFFHNWYLVLWREPLYNLMAQCSSFLCIFSTCMKLLTLAGNSWKLEGLGKSGAAHESFINSAQLIMRWLLLHNWFPDWNIVYSIWKRERMRDKLWENKQKIMWETKPMTDFFGHYNCV